MRLKWQLTGFNEYLLLPELDLITRYLFRALDNIIYFYLTFYYKSLINALLIFSLYIIGTA